MNSEHRCSPVLWVALLIFLNLLNLLLQWRSQEKSPETIKERANQLQSELRSHVQSRSYGTRRRLIEAPLKKLDLDLKPCVGWVRDPRLVEPLSEETPDDIVAAFKSSRRRLLIVGKPGSGKTMAAYTLIEHLDETEGDKRIPLLINLSAWGAQKDFEVFLINYLCSSVGYQVREPAVAATFISSLRYNLVLDGLDEIPAGLRKNFSKRLDAFVRGLSSEIAVVVTCRTREYQKLINAHRTGLGLVQAVEILPLSSQQFDSALVELARFEDENWEALLSQRHIQACRQARDVLSNPLFLNLAVIGHLKPRQLLECAEKQELRDLVLDSYLDRILSDQSKYEPADARRYLGWIARFLNGVKVSPFGLKTTDATVFDFADLTPPDPPRRYRVLEALGAGLVVGLFFGRLWAPIPGLFFGLVEGVLVGWPFRRSAVSSRLILAGPSTRPQLLSSLRRAGRGLANGFVWGLVSGLVLGLLVFGPPLGLFLGTVFGLVFGLVNWLVFGLGVGLYLGLFFGLVFGLGFGLVGWTFETRSVLVTSRTPKEASSRSLIAALLWVVFGLVGGLVGGLFFGLFAAPFPGLFLPLVTVMVIGLSVGLGLGLHLGIRNGGGFVLLQKVAHRHLARAGNLPPRPYDFLEWGIERQIFRRVGGGVRFRHSFIQQHLANALEESSPHERERFNYEEEPPLSSSRLIRWGGLAAILSGTFFVFIALYELFFPSSLSGSSLLAGELEILGLVCLYARHPKALGVFGLTAFLIALLGEVGMFGNYLSLRIALENKPYLLSLYYLGWLLLGVSFLRAQLYSRVAAILLIITSLLFGLVSLILLLSASVPWHGVTVSNIFTIFLDRLLSLPYLDYIMTVLYIFNNISIAWLGLTLWTGKDSSAGSSTQQP